MTYEDKASYDSTPPCNVHIKLDVQEPCTGHIDNAKRALYSLK